MTGRRRPFPGADYLTEDEYRQGIAGDLTVVDVAVQRKGTATGCGTHPVVRNPFCQTCRDHAKPGDHFAGDPD